MTDHQTTGFPSSQQLVASQNYNGSHTLDFTGDKNDVTTNAWTMAAVSGEFHLNQVDSFRFRTSLIEIVEELKLRRKNEEENEERTQILIKEKHELERKIDLDANRIKNLQDENSKGLTETKRKFEEKMRVLEEKARQDSVQKESLEKEMEAMKDELRRLQLSKYTMEKLLRDQERKAQIQSDSTQQHLQQLSAVEHKLQAFSSYCTKLVDSQKRLDRQVKEAIKLNQTLTYVNEHQKCLIGRDQEVIASLEVRLLEANKKVQDKPTVCSDSGLRLDMARITQQLEGKTTKVDILEGELEEQKSRCNETMAKLQDSYLLIERHLANAATHRDEAGILRHDKEELEGKCEALKLALDSTHKDLDIQLSLHEQAVQQWNIKSTETAEEIEKLKGDLEMTSKNCEQLEELNSNWVKHNLELSTSLQEAKAILDVPKCETEVQTDVSLFEVNDVSCQTSIDVASVLSQTDSPVTHPAYTQTYSPALATHQTQTVCTPRHVAGTQTRVAAVANTGTMATTDMADRGVQTLPVRVYRDFNETTSGCTKETGPNRNENLSIEKSIFTSTSDSCKDKDVNKCSDVDVQESCTCVDEKVDEMEDEGSQITVDTNRHGTYTYAREKSTGNGCLTQIESITDTEQSDSDLNTSCSHEVSTNSVVSLRTSRTPGEENHKTQGVSQASGVTNRLRIMPSENDTQTTAAALNTVLNPPVADVVKEMESDEEIVEFVSPQSNNLSNAVGGKLEPRRSPDNSILISSFRDFGHVNVEHETKDSDRVSKVSPRTSGLSLSLRKPRLQSKKESTVCSDPVEEDSPSLMPSEKPSRKSTGKFKLNSEKPGSLFEGKALLDAYVAARSSSGGRPKQSPFQDITERRRTSLRGSLDGHRRNLSDSRETRYSYNVETKEMVMHSTERSGRADIKTKSLGKQIDNNKVTMKSRQVPSSDSRYASVIESSVRETKAETEKLSPYSRYSAMFRFRLSANTSESQTKEVNSQNQQIDSGFSDPDKNRDSVRGILKGFNERAGNAKSVRFDEGPPETKIIEDCPGERSLFSDGEEDVISDESSQFVSLEDFQSDADTSEPKRRKLE